MATGKVTISSIAKLEGWLWDSAVQGFGARRQTNGTYYYLRYRHQGRQLMRSIGRHGSPWTPDTARIEARRLLGAVAGGADPFAPAPIASNFASELERYLSRKRASLRPRWLVQVQHHLCKQAVPLHSLPLGQIDRRAIATLLGDVETNSGPTARNRTRSSLSAFFAWAIAEGLLDANPVVGTAKAAEGGSRERVLTDAELAQLWAALDARAFADIVMLLALTGQRRDEIGQLQWDEVDFGRGLIVLPPARVKNNREHCVPLSAQAAAILQRRPRLGEFVFGRRAFVDWSRAKLRLDRDLRIADWRLHDLRRTCATGMAELGVLPHIIEAVLNHVSGHKAGVAGIYNRSKMLEPMRDALQRWGDHIDQITNCR
jgi:integrase